MSDLGRIILNAEEAAAVRQLLSERMEQLADARESQHYSELDLVRIRGTYTRLIVAIDAVFPARLLSDGS